MNIDFLHEFVFLADSLSFKRTADHFYVSRSVISRHMAALEETVGIKLLDRDNRSVSLTDAGAVFYREAKIVLRDWETALERVHATRESAATIVRVGYLRNAARPVLVRFVKHMSERHPDVRLSLVCMEYSELRRAMDEHAVDVALAVNVHPSLSRNYRCTHIYDDRYYAVCAKTHPLAGQKDGVSLDDLRDQKLLLPDSYVYAGLSDVVDELVDEKTMLVAQSFYRDIDMLYLKVQTEDYIAFSSGMNNQMFGDKLAVLPVSGVDTAFSVSAFYHDQLIGDAYEACREGFEWCSGALADWSLDFNMEFFGQ